LIGIFTLLSLGALIGAGVGGVFAFVGYNDIKEYQKMTAYKLIRYCVHCGRAIPFNSEFCPYCGKQLWRSHPANATEPI